MENGNGNGNTGGPTQAVPMKGRWVVEHLRGGARIGVYEVENAITNQGKNRILDCMFNQGAQVAANSWYVGLIDNGTGSVATAPGDTLAVGGHAGWNEFTGYSGNRPAWGQGAASGQQVTNNTPASFTITATGSLYGLFVCSVATGGSGSDVLWNTAAFSAAVPVAVNDIMKCAYTLAT